MTFTKTLIGMLIPCLISSVLFVFALEGAATFSQCMLISMGIFILINCAAALANASRPTFSMISMPLEAFMSEEQIEELHKPTHYERDEDGNFVEVEEDDNEKS